MVTRWNHFVCSLPWFSVLCRDASRRTSSSDSFEEYIFTQTFSKAFFACSFRATTCNLKLRVVDIRCYICHLLYSRFVVSTLQANVLFVLLCKVKISLCNLYLFIYLFIGYNSQRFLITAYLFNLFMSLVKTLKHSFQGKGNYTTYLLYCRMTMKTTY